MAIGGGLKARAAGLSPTGCRCRHTLACELDIGDERTEMFEIYSVLHNLGRRGYACQVGRRMNPLLASCEDDEDEEDDEE
ncbi:MAG: hypothetical protein E6764_26695 [Klebsiella pneumoniae]|nr:hypothetical protein [Klebsiella pneumoniae]